MTLSSTTSGLYRKVNSEVSSSTSRFLPVDSRDSTVVYTSLVSPAPILIGRRTQMRLNFKFPSHSSSVNSRELAVAYPGVAARHGVEWNRTESRRRAPSAASTPDPVRTRHARCTRSRYYFSHHRALLSFLDLRPPAQCEADFVFQLCEISTCSAQSSTANG